VPFMTRRRIRYPAIATVRVVSRWRWLVFLRTLLENLTADALAFGRMTAGTRSGVSPVEFLESRGVAAAQTRRP
jgi:hypothetical protein